MNWFVATFGSSIGKKLLMAVTGLCFIGFLTGHLAGNLTMYAGGDAFNSYAEHLHSLEPFLTLVEIALLSMAVIHVTVGLWLFVQNLKARPNRYAVNKRAGGRTIGSATMPYTGILILVFVIFHLLNFSFVDKTNTTIWQIVSTAFANPLYVLIYIAAVVIVAFHISHGLWSLFQTLGANHPKYMPFIFKASIAVSLIFGIGFGLLPLYVSMFA